MMDFANTEAGPRDAARRHEAFVSKLLTSLAGLKRVKLRGLAKVSRLMKSAAAAYNLWRLPKLQAQAG